MASWFSRFAKWVSSKLGHPLAFFIAVLIIVVWARFLMAATGQLQWYLLRAAAPRSPAKPSSAGTSGSEEIQDDRHDHGKQKCWYEQQEEVWRSALRGLDKYPFQAAAHAHNL